MDKKEKFLNKIPIQDRIRILEVIDYILAGNIASLNVKKLKASNDQYRVRVGIYRIKFKKYANFNELKAEDILKQLSINTPDN